MKVTSHQVTIGIVCAMLIGCVMVASVFATTRTISLSGTGTSPSGAPTPPALSNALTISPSSSPGGICSIVGNGSTDDSACYQSILNAGHDIQINAGTYFIGNNVNMPSGRNIRCGAGTNPPDGTEILSNPTTTGNINIFVYSGSTNGSVFGCTFAGPNYNVNAQPTCQNTFWEAIKVSNGTNHLHIANNDFNGAGGFVGAVELTADSSAGSPPTLNTIEYNTAEHCGYRGFEVTGGTHNTFQHNVSSDCGESNEALDTANGGYRVQNNLMDHETLSWPFGEGQGRHCFGNFTNNGFTNHLSGGIACHQGAGQPACPYDYSSNVVSNSTCGPTSNGASAYLFETQSGGGNATYTNDTVSSSCTVF